MTSRERARRELTRAIRRAALALSVLIDEDDDGAIERALLEVRRARDRLVLAEVDLLHVRIGSTDLVAA
jgi:hypothetical protein